MSVGTVTAAAPLEVVGIEDTPAVALDFERAYAENAADALRWATGLLANADDAADLVHEAFVRIFSKVRPLRDPAAFRAYLRKAIVHGAASRWRSQARDAARVERVSQLDGPRVQGLGDVVDPALVEAVAKLPARQRSVIVLRYWLDWSEEDIAASLGCRRGTVKSLASRALDVLRTELADG